MPQRLTRSPQAWIPDRPSVFMLCSGRSFECLCQDVLRGIHVAIMMRSALRTRPFTYREVLYKRVLVAADATCLARRVEGVHLVDYCSTPSRLVCELTEEF